MSDSQKILILNKNHQLDIEEIKQETKSICVTKSPSESFSFDQKMKIVEAVTCIIEYQDVKYDSDVFFVEGHQASAAFLRLKDEHFIAAYALSVEHCETCINAIKTLKNINDTREMLSDFYNSHHHGLAYHRMSEFSKSLRNYTDVIEDLFADYGASETIDCTEAIDQALSMKW